MNSSCVTRTLFCLSANTLCRGMNLPQDSHMSWRAQQLVALRCADLCTKWGCDCYEDKIVLSNNAVDLRTMSMQSAFFSLHCRAVDCATVNNEIETNQWLLCLCAWHVLCVNHFALVTCCGTHTEQGMAHNRVPHCFFCATRT